MKKIASLYLAFVFLVLYIPIFYLIAYAFNAGEDMNRFTGFSLSHFQNLFEDSRLILILVQRNLHLIHLTLETLNEFFFLSKLIFFYH